MNDSIFIRLICAFFIALCTLSTSDFNIHQKAGFFCGIALLLFIRFKLEYSLSNFCRSLNRLSRRKENFYKQENSFLKIHNE